MIRSSVESISKRLSSLHLRLKEFVGRIEPEEFNRLLEHDFSMYIEGNPPLNEEFSPKHELDKLKQLPKDDKKPALDRFRKNFASQRMAMGMYQRFAERILEQDNDAPRETLINWLDRFKSMYGFDDEQTGVAVKLIDLYYETRRKTLELRKQYPNNQELIRYLTGVTLSEDEILDISIGPMAIEIETTPFNSGRLYEHTDSPVIGYRFGGFMGVSDDGEFSYIVISNSLGRKARFLTPATRQSMLKHERTHVKNRLFREAFGIAFNYEVLGKQFNTYKAEQDSEKSVILLEDYFLSNLQALFEFTGDEILAYMSDGTVVNDSFLDRMFFKKGCTYDDIFTVREYEDEKNPELYRAMAQKILKEKYEQIVREAVEALTILQKEGGYSRQEIAALVIDQPLNKWPKVVLRLLA